MPGVCNHGVGMEHVAADALGNCHGKIGIKPYSCYTYAGIAFIPRGEVGIVVMMVMVVTNATVLVVIMELPNTHDVRDQRKLPGRPKLQ